MLTLRKFSDDTPFTPSEAELGVIVKKINEELAALSCFREVLTDGGAVNTDVWTFMGSNESLHCELAKLVGYDSILAKLKVERHAEVREKNQEIRRLTDQLGRGCSVAAVVGALRRYESNLREWCTSVGFDYCHVVSLSTGWLSAELTPTMNVVVDEPEGGELKTDGGFALAQTSRHRLELLDTDANRQLVRELLGGQFAGVRVTGFSSRVLDDGQFALTTRFDVPYADLDAFTGGES